VATGRDVASAVDNAIHLEWLASIYYHAILCGSPSILTEAQLQAVRDQVRDLRYGMKARAQ
jgi:ribulose-5-phosphate 4-epimerase/fuculose-1-phosphate aldolase